MANREWRELTRYILNGVTSTAAHFLVLTINVEILRFESAGMANFVAALFGSTVAFVGNRYFVFQKFEEAIHRQAMKFVFLYLSMACLHGAALFVWSDICKWGYRSGFLVATAIQVVAGFLGNKYLVFKK
jgi:putative flippase GtrA